MNDEAGPISWPLPEPGVTPRRAAPQALRAAGFLIDLPPVCAGCPCPIDDHRLVAYADPQDGGLVLCPRCALCAATWGASSAGRDIPGREPSRDLPPLHVIQAWRQAAFGLN
jgi:hypothetical protein